MSGFENCNDNNSTGRETLLQDIDRKICSPTQFLHAMNRNLTIIQSTAVKHHYQDRLHQLQQSKTMIVKWLSFR